MTGGRGKNALAAGLVIKRNIAAVMGVPSARQASEMPSMACESWAMVSGFSGCQN